jgi:hypothetical protein
MSDQSFAPGDRVSVPWGLDVLEGTVVSSHGHGPGRQVVVSVELPDTEEETQLVTFSARLLEDAAEEASERQPGAWLPAYRYEERVRDALERLADDALTGPTLERERPSGQPIDFILSSGDHRLVIEAKTASSGRVGSKAIDQLMHNLKRSKGSAGLLVSNADLSPAAVERIQQARYDGYNIRAIQWHSMDDNPHLSRTISELLSVA